LSCLPQFEECHEHLFFDMNNDQFRRLVLGNLLSTSSSPNANNERALDKTGPHQAGSRQRASILPMIP
jgi:hypothetical protein